MFLCDDTTVTEIDASRAGAAGGVFLRVLLLKPLPLQPGPPAEEHLDVIETLSEEEEEPRVQRRGAHRAGAPRSPSNKEGK